MVVLRDFLDSEKTSRSDPMRVWVSFLFSFFSSHFLEQLSSLHFYFYNFVYRMVIIIKF